MRKMSRGTSPSTPVRGGCDLPRMTEMMSAIVGARRMATSGARRKERISMQSWRPETMADRDAGDQPGDGDQPDEGGSERRAPERGEPDQRSEQCDRGNARD